MYDVFYARNDRYTCITFGTMNGVTKYLWDCGLHPNKWYIEGKEVYFKGGPTGIELVHWDTPEGVNETDVDKKSLEWSREVDDRWMELETNPTPSAKAMLELAIEQKPVWN